MWSKPWSGFFFQLATKVCDIITIDYTSIHFLIIFVCNGNWPHTKNIMKLALLVSSSLFFLTCSIPPVICVSLCVYLIFENCTVHASWAYQLSFTTVVVNKTNIRVGSQQLTSKIIIRFLSQFFISLILLPFCLFFLPVYFLIVCVFVSQCMIFDSFFRFWENEQQKKNMSNQTYWYPHPESELCATNSIVREQKLNDEKKDQQQKCMYWITSNNLFNQKMSNYLVIVSI